MREWFDSGAGSNDVSFWDRWDLLKYYQGLDKFFHGNIRVVPYEMMKDSKQEYCSVVSDFFAIDDVQLKIEKTVNEANFQTNYWQVFKLLSRPKYWSNVKQEIKRKPRYDDVLIRQIDEHFQEDNKHLAELTNIELANYGYY